MSTLLENRYQVIRKLNCGGFGDTFLAEDLHMPSGRQCVIKKLKPNTSEPSIYKLIQERFQREAVILEKLGCTQPQIPNLYAFFESNQQFILVQEWIQGETIATKLQTQQIYSEEEVTKFLLDLLPVLDYIHQQQIVHRDIKPENIILRQTDKKPVLIDFGAVKEAMGTTLNSYGNSASSIIVGTPGFMAPEQGVGRPVYSSDLYSLGLTAIYMLTGKAPNELALDPYNGEFSWLSPNTLVGESLVKVLDKAVCYHPRDRYTSATEMLSALKCTVRPITLQRSEVAAAKCETSLMAQTAETKHSNLGKIIYLGSLLTGGLIGGAIVLASFIQLYSSVSHDTVPIKKAEQENPKQRSSQQSSSTVVTETSSPLPPSKPSISTESSVQTSEPKVSSIGWIRLGAVGNTSGYASVGEKLIETTQPVTVSPMIVPEVNALVLTVTGVNLRKTYPLPPNFKLAEKKSTFLANQRLKILDIKTFVDFTSPSPYTVIWAEVGLP